MKLAGQTALAAVFLLVPASAVAWLLGGSRGAIGLLAGLGVATASVYSFALLARSLAPSGSRSSTVLMTLVWLMKLPILWVVISYNISLGAAAVNCFLAGLALVYFAMVHRALVEGKARE